MLTTVEGHMAELRVLSSLAQRFVLFAIDEVHTRRSSGRPDLGCRPVRLCEEELAI